MPAAEAVLAAEPNEEEAPVAVPATATLVVLLILLLLLTGALVLLLLLLLLLLLPVAAMYAEETEVRAGAGGLEATYLFVICSDTRSFGAG